MQDEGFEEIEDLHNDVKKLMKFFEDMKIPDPSKCSQLEEILLSILHFCQYSVPDALFLASNHFDRIISKIVKSDEKSRSTNY